MDITALTDILANFGYPIVVTGALFWYMVTEQRTLRETLENNTIALTKLITFFNKDEEDE